MSAIDVAELYNDTIARMERLDEVYRDDILGILDMLLSGKITRDEYNASVANREKVHKQNLDVEKRALLDLAEKYRALDGDTRVQ